MKNHRNTALKLLAIAGVLLGGMGCTLRSEPMQVKDLPSWRDTDARERIIDFVEVVTDPNSTQFVPPENRIATFDNDGTLWCEKPIPPHFFGILARFQELTQEDPDLVKQEPFTSIGEFIETQDPAALKLFIDEYHDGELLKVVGQLFGVPFANMNVDEYAEWYAQFYRDWEHPTLEKSISGLTYQPMLELLDYLRTREFQVFIFSADEGAFLKLLSNELYGIPPNQAFGSTIKTQYREGEIIRTEDGEWLDNWQGKPEMIQAHIGKRPIFAAGNSNGDFHMLEYVHLQPGPHLSVMIHHTDEEREFAYDTHTDQLLPYAKKHDYLIVDMAEDWDRVFSE
ncbi:haloacid dehalogenase-like hydrolase [Pontibacter sp. G13]|uniref:HAD family hydrolase n=1 Tax=Pontibacter sp. G13 TaxID=3074898 RepID=UPI00288AF420|nr:haloacid dehalogenase-like hydrolase [Pontibacter sp. G13]WNJ17795.1 haloacid dehalogenase-like hydrolase [Pontibacter sp. G13]